MTFFDELPESFYVQLGTDFKDPARYQPGQLFFADVPYSEEQRQYWRPVDYDKLTQTQSTQFNIVGGATDLFKRAFPLMVPRLAINEEFPVVRAKRRPVVLFARPGAGPLGQLARHHLVIPRYGAVKPGSDQPKLPTEIVSRVRILEFPDIMFSPAHGAELTKDGFFLSHLIQPCPLSRLEATRVALSNEALTVLRGQFLHRCFGQYVGDYADWREMLLNQPR